MRHRANFRCDVAFSTATAPRTQRSSRAQRRLSSRHHSLRFSRARYRRRSQARCRKTLWSESCSSTMQAVKAALGAAFSKWHVNARAHEFCGKVVGTMASSMLVVLIIYRLIIKPALKPHHVRRCDSLEPTHDALDDSHPHLSTHRPPPLSLTHTHTHPRPRPRKTNIHTPPSLCLFFIATPPSSCLPSPSSCSWPFCFCWRRSRHPSPSYPASSSSS